MFDILTEQHFVDSYDENEPVTPREEMSKAVQYATRLDATLKSCITGHAFVNGKHFDLDDVRITCLVYSHVPINCRIFSGICRQRSAYSCNICRKRQALAFFSSLL